MKNPPTLARLSEKIEKVLRENIEVTGTIDHQASLMSELNLDSLDMIELSFSLEEFFGFEFATKDAFEALNEASEGIILENGFFTNVGKNVVLKRAPELQNKDFPDQLSPSLMQQFYSVATFARLIQEFYLAAPDTCPRTGEPVVEREFRLQSESSAEPVGTKTGDDILDDWVGNMLAELKRETA